MYVRSFVSGCLSFIKTEYLNNIPRGIFSAALKKRFLRRDTFILFGMGRDFVV